MENVGKFYECLEFLRPFGILYIRPFGIFYGYLLYFMAIWYIFMATWHILH
jgi:hypothetical protein